MNGKGENGVRKRFWPLAMCVVLYNMCKFTSKQKLLNKGVASRRKMLSSINGEHYMLKCQLGLQ